MSVALRRARRVLDHVHRQCDLLFASLINDVSSRIFDVLPDETWFHPGTATTPPSASSAHTSQSGVNVTGEPLLPFVRQ